MHVWSTKLDMWNNGIHTLLLTYITPLIHTGAATILVDQESQNGQMPIGSCIPHCTLPILHKHHIYIHSMPGQEHNDLCMCVGMGDGDTQMYRIVHNTVCVLLFAEFIFRRFAISAFFCNFKFIRGCWVQKCWNIHGWNISGYTEWARIP